MNAPQQNTQPQPTQQQSPYGNLSQQDRSAIEGMQPGDSYVIQGDKQQPSMEKPNKTFAENRANYAGVVKEGEELGKIRAGDIKELNDVVYRGQTNQYTLDNVSKILGSPEFEQIRQVPLLGKHELSYYAKFGTPEQQNMIGQYYTSTGNIIKDSARDFAGQFRKGEQQLLENMKPSASDTPDTARGKVESLSVMNKMLLERSKLISQYMQKNHMNKGEAEDIADKQIDGDEIRKQIHDNLYPKVKIRNKTTGEEKEISIDEARKLGIQNV